MSSGGRQLASGSSGQSGSGRPNLVNMCGYTLATKWQNFMEIYLA